MCIEVRHIRHLYPHALIINLISTQPQGNSMLKKRKYIDVCSQKKREKRRSKKKKKDWAHAKFPFT